MFAAESSEYLLHHQDRPQDIARGDLRVQEVGEGLAHQCISQRVQLSAP